MTEHQPPFPPPVGPAGHGAPAFDASDAIAYGWKKFFANPGPFLLITLFILVSGGIIQTAGNVISGLGPDYGDSLADLGVMFGFGIVDMVFSLISQVVVTFLSAAAIRGALDVVEGQPVSLGAMFARWDKLQVLIAAILISVASTIGLSMCILPGLVVVFMTWFATFFIVGGGRNAIDGITDSLRLTGTNLGQLLTLAVLSVLVCLAGLLACVVGLLVALPLMTIASAYAFRVLHGLPVAP